MGVPRQVPLESLPLLLPLSRWQVPAYSQPCHTCSKHQSDRAGSEGPLESTLGSFLACSDLAEGERSTCQCTYTHTHPYTRTLPGLDLEDSLEGTDSSQVRDNPEPIAATAQLGGPELALSGSAGSQGKEGGSHKGRLQIPGEGFRCAGTNTQTYLTQTHGGTRLVPDTHNSQPKLLFSGAHPPLTAVPLSLDQHLSF